MIVNYVLIIIAIALGALIIIITFSLFGIVAYNDAPANIVEQQDCMHLDITDVVDECFAQYELVSTYCMDCGKKLNERQDGF